MADGFSLGDLKLQTKSSVSGANRSKCQLCCWHKHLPVPFFRFPFAPFLRPALGEGCSLPLGGAFEFGNALEQCVHSRPELGVLGEELCVGVRIEMPGEFGESVPSCQDNAK